MREVFQRAAGRASRVMGSPWGFCTAALVVLGWAISGPIFDFSDTWQLIINTGTTIVTFLMVFLIQGSQNRDARAMHLKLDELLRSSNARDTFEDIEHATEAELDRKESEFKRD